MDRPVVDRALGRAIFPWQCRRVQLSKRNLLARIEGDSGVDCIDKFEVHETDREVHVLRHTLA